MFQLQIMVHQDQQAEGQLGSGGGVGEECLHLDAEVPGSIPGIN